MERLDDDDVAGMVEQRAYEHAAGLRAFPSFSSSVDLRGGRGGGGKDATSVGRSWNWADEERRREPKRGEGGVGDARERREEEEEEEEIRGWDRSGNPFADLEAKLTGREEKLEEERQASKHDR